MNTKLNPDFRGRVSTESRIDRYSPRSIKFLQYHMFRIGSERVDSFIGHIRNAISLSLSLSP